MLGMINKAAKVTAKVSSDMEGKRLLGKIRENAQKIKK